MFDIGTDPEAFEAFYRRHVRMVTGFVARRVLDPHLVDDLTTEVFLRKTRLNHQASAVALLISENPL